MADTVTAPPESVGVTAPPPADVPTTQSDVSNQIPQPQGQTPPQQQTAQTQPQPVAQQQPQPHENGLMAILHAVGNALGGGKTTSVVNPQTGGIEQQNRSTGSKVGSAVSMLVRGAAAGASQRGAGAFGKGAVAGINEQEGFQKDRQQETKDQSENVRQTQEARQHELLTQASLAKSNQEVADMALAHKRNGLEFSKEQADIINQMHDVQGIPGATKLGEFNSDEELGDYLSKISPEQSAQHAKDFANNNIRVVPKADGGFTAYQVPKGWQEKPIGEGKTLSIYTAEAGPDGKPKPTFKTVAAPPDMKMGDYLQWQGQTLTTSANQQMHDANVTQKLDEGKKDIAEASNAYAEGKLHLAQAKNLSGGNAKNDDGSWNEASIPVALVEHNMDPSQLSKRSADYNAKLEAAGKYSLERYGKPFDIEQAQSDYKYATNPATQNTLKLIKGMTDQGGAIDIAQNAARGLPAFNERTVNKIFNMGATELGSKEATDVHTAMLGLADEYSKVMGGGISSDTGRKQALDILKDSYSKGQIAGAFAIMQKDIQARQSALVGNNPYLGKQYKVAPQSQQATGGLSNFHVNPQTGARIGWNGQAWVNAPAAGVQ